MPACVLFLSNCCWTTTALPVQALVPWPLSTFVWQSPPLPANQHMAACPHLLTGQPGLSSNYASSLGLFLDPDTNYMHKLASFNRGRGSSSEVALWASNRWTRVRLPAKLDGCFMPCIASLPWSLPLKLPLWHQCVSTGIAKERRQCTREYHFPFSHLCTILSCHTFQTNACLSACRTGPHLHWHNQQTLILNISLSLPFLCQLCQLCLSVRVYSMSGLC